MWLDEEDLTGKLPGRRQVFLRFLALALEVLELYGQVISEITTDTSVADEGSDILGHDGWLWHSSSFLWESEMRLAPRMGYTTGTERRNAQRGGSTMMTEHLQRVMEQASALPAEEQERLARLLELLLEQPTVSSGVVRPEVMEAAQAVIAESTAALDYLRDK
jgi:hypothetical protein